MLNWRAPGERKNGIEKEQEKKEGRLNEGMSARHKVQGISNLTFLLYEKVLLFLQFICRVRTVKNPEFLSHYVTRAEAIFDHDNFFIMITKICLNVLNTILCRAAGRRL